MCLIIDVGNTRVKVAVFEIDTVKEVFVFEKAKIISELKKITSRFSVSNSIISSVANFTEKEKQKIVELLNPVFLDSNTKVPFKNLYKTPKTLGVDRIALASAAINKFPNKNVLVLDAGTCITYDFITNEGKYLGGAISPGVAMRYKALHTFTSKLPLLEMEEVENFIGVDTKSSIHSGVINGVSNEIDGIIAQYQKKYPDLTVVLTGGDTYFLSKQLKSVIFAHPNFVLEGLHTILIHNLAND
ncbi:type III pantothenate kinase [Tenacibaculum sp. 1B UA]|uniref:type III pantothenate kinase n=1 Tax=unclassified Tenacibaculum TaxID=2635139 RepID=UPI0026E11C4E|nr:MULTISPECIES: type III pantothenate kinase [unclassified Tenacibaculum]MDO6676721.1 type III pantothenate kinase [Tenacibaculum sp. 1_MG-2023]MDX8552924.1 type III pantothenate kinase [Tenacibaculum sp. 1B UA]